MGGRAGGRVPFHDFRRALVRGRAGGRAGARLCARPHEVAQISRGGS